MATTTEQSIPKAAGPGGFELSTLDPLDRVLLINDGTLTDVLAALYLENLSLVTLKEEVGPARRRIELLGLDEGEVVLERRVLLRGQRSHRPYVCAHCLVVLDRLTPRIRQALLASDAWLGQLWKASGTEIFMQILRRDREPAGELFEYLHLGPDSQVLVRTYRACAGRRPVALIREHIVPPSTRARERSRTVGRTRRRNQTHVSATP
jgi:chorismate-pyruvate lyase